MKSIKFLFLYNRHELKEWYQNYFSNLLFEDIQFEISDNPDFIFCAAHEDLHLRYPKAVKIAFAAENLRINFNLFDYGIGFDHMSFGDRYLRYPLYLLYTHATTDALQKHNNINTLPKNRFCNFIVSNGSADEFRVSFFHTLNKYKKVDSAGRYLNNIGYNVKDKLSFQKECKFSICFENSSTPGYLTEKLIEAAASQTIPIYWGDSTVSMPLNQNGSGINDKAFINMHQFKDVNDAVNLIQEIDTNDELFVSYLKQAFFQDADHVEYYNAKLKSFLINIFSQPKDTAFRRGFGQVRIGLEKKQIHYNTLTSSSSLLFELIRRLTKRK